MRIEEDNEAGKGSAVDYFLNILVFSPRMHGLLQDISLHWVFTKAFSPFTDLPHQLLHTVFADALGFLLFHAIVCIMKLICMQECG